MQRLGQLLSFGAILGLAGIAPARADVGVFISTVGFDNDANLDRASGFGVRWGTDRGLLGGETCLMVARPDREIAGNSETTTAFFYEGRMLLSVPFGQWRPFVGVGLGAVTLSSTDSEVPANADQAVATALDIVANSHTNTSFSYGTGVRYALTDRFRLRVDARQYVVFSVKGIATDQLAQELQTQTGLASVSELTKDNTVHYNEFSVGITARF